MKSFLFCVILIMFFHPTFCQIISGSVKSDITDSIPIWNSYIEITNIDKPVNERMTMTDSLGLFELKGLKLNETYHLKVSTPGYEDQVFEVKTADSIIKITLRIKGDCYYSKDQAESDWKNGQGKLLIFGSIAPIANSPGDKKFEKTYKIRYFDFGDSPPAQECIRIYNERIFALMDKEFGVSWRKMVRKDVEYLKSNALQQYIKGH